MRCNPSVFTPNHCAGHVRWHGPQVLQRLHRAPPLNASWKQASLGFAHAGLRLRPTSHHAPAAYLASWAAALRSATDIDASFSVDESKASPAVAAAVAAFNAQVDPARAITIAHQSRRCHQQRCWRHPADVYLPAFAGGSCCLCLRHRPGQPAGRCSCRGVRSPTKSSIFRRLKSAKPTGSNSSAGG